MQVSDKPGDREAFCYLVSELPAPFRAEARPSGDYFTQYLFHYVVRCGDRVFAEKQGDYRTLASGELGDWAKAVVKAAAEQSPVGAKSESLNEVQRESTGDVTWRDSRGRRVMATRLLPERHPVTWFSSGRAAFFFAMLQRPEIRQIWLPSYVCWSLVDVVLARLSHLRLRFYPIDEALCGVFPEPLDESDAVVRIHYFGKPNELQVPDSALLLDDRSHLLDWSDDVPGVSRSRPSHNTLVFGSLRKQYRTADGGFLLGDYNPRYEIPPADAWLRREADDWRSLREAENMTDREWTVADISSRSLQTVLGNNQNQTSEVCRRNDRLLREGLTVGTPWPGGSVQYTPLYHNRLFEDQQGRDSLRRALAEESVYCPVHWPLHPVLLQPEYRPFQGAAALLSERMLTFPISDVWTEEDMQRTIAICERRTRRVK